MLLNRQRTYYRLICVSLSLVALILVLKVSPLSAQSVSSIAQGFQTSDSGVVAGALVSLQENSPNSVELSTASNAQQLVGVAGGKSLIELGGTGSVQVVTSGTTEALVSDINGTVETGDKITASPIAGIGMKATTSGIVVGVAQDNLGNVHITSQKVTEKDGKTITIHIGVIPVEVDKVFYQAPTNNNSFLPPALSGFASSIAGHTVSPVRILVASLLVIMLFLGVTILLYSAVRSSIISIGRNPLSESAVRKSLNEVGLTILGVLVFVVIVVYLILTT